MFQAVANEIKRGAEMFQAVVYGYNYVYTPSLANVELYKTSRTLGSL